MEAGAFPPTLTQLGMNGNSIARIDGAAFQGLTALSVLTLHDNPALHSLDFLQPVASTLNVLSLTNTGVDAFDIDIPSLGFLWLSNNPITQLPDPSRFPNMIGLVMQKLLNILLLSMYECLLRSPNHDDMPK